MPRPRSLTPPKYRLHRARNVAVVTIDGKDHYLGPYGSPESRERYAQLIANWQPIPAAAVAPHLVIAPITIGELTLRYAEFARGYYVKGGQQTAQVVRILGALRELNRLYASELAADFGPLKLKALQASLIGRVDQRTRREEKQRTISRNYINALISCIVRAFKWAVSEELVPPAVHQSLTKVEGLKAGRTMARESAGVQPVESGVVERTLQVVPPHLASMIRLQMLTGMRPEDVTSMRPCDLTCPATGPWIYQPETHKCLHLGQKRVVFFGPQARAVLAEWMENLPAESVIFSQQRRRPLAPPGPRFDKDTYRQSIQRYCRRHNIPLWSPNQLRHLHGTRVRQQFGLEGAQVVLGHSRADTTQIYAERDLGLAAKIQELVG